MIGWVSDKSWSDRFMPEIKAVLGVHLIGEATAIDDQQHNTDLIVLTMNAVRIGCRVRRPQYLDKYADEFTIRCGRPNGTKTELAKIIEGWGDYFFYGISDPKQERLACYILGDLKVFRLWFLRTLCKHGGKPPGMHRVNNDNSSDFYAYKIESLPPEFAIARKTPVTPKTPLQVPDRKPIAPGGSEPG